MPSDRSELPAHAPPREEAAGSATRTPGTSWGHSPGQGAGDPLQPSQQLLVLVTAQGAWLRWCLHPVLCAAAT